METLIALPAFNMGSPWQVQPLLAFPRVQGVLGVHVGAEAAAVDLAGPELHQLLRCDWQGRIMQNGPRRVDVLDELHRQGAAEVIETGVHRHLLAVLAGHRLSRWFAGWCVLVSRTPTQPAGM